MIVWVYVVAGFIFALMLIKIMRVEDPLAGR